MFQIFEAVSECPNFTLPKWPINQFKTVQKANNWHYVLTVLMDILCLDVFFESFNNNFRWLSIQFWISQVGFSFKFGIEGNQIIELLSWSFSNVRDVIIEIDIVSLLKLNIFICSLILINISFVLLGCRLSKIGKISDQKSTYLPIGNLCIMLNCHFW